MTTGKFKCYEQKEKKETFGGDQFKALIMVMVSTPNQVVYIMYCHLHVDHTSIKRFLKVLKGFPGVPVQFSRSVVSDSL